MKPAIVVFRPRAGTWLLHGFLTLLFALNSLYWFFDPVPVIVKYFGVAFFIFWFSYLISLGQARVELRESTVEIRGPSYQVLHPRELHGLYQVLLLLVIADVAALFFGPLPLGVRRLLLGVRFSWLVAYLWCFGAFEGGRRSVKYTEITTAPWEIQIRRSALLQMGISNDTSTFSFPSWLNAADRREVVGRITARMKHAQALQTGHEPKVDRVGRPQPEGAPLREGASE